MHIVIVVELITAIVVERFEFVNPRDTNDHLP